MLGAVKGLGKRIMCGLKEVCHHLAPMIVHLKSCNSSQTFSHPYFVLLKVLLLAKKHCILWFQPNVSRQLGHCPDACSLLSLPEQFCLPFLTLLTPSASRLLPLLGKNCAVLLPVPSLLASHGKCSGAIGLECCLLMAAPEGGRWANCRKSRPMAPHPCHTHPLHDQLPVLGTKNKLSC